MAELVEVRLADAPEGTPSGFVPARSLDHWKAKGYAPVADSTDGDVEDPKLLDESAPADGTAADNADTTPTGSPSKARGRTASSS